MKRYSLKECFSIPNIMGYFRILLIPVFTYLYYMAETTRDYYAAAGIVLLSTLTDFLDGKIARHFHMITEWGKLVDPVADKLTHLALVICLAIRYPLMYLLLVILVVKEGFMAVMGVIKLKTKGKKLDGAKWFGKVCTALLYLVLFLLVLAPDLPRPAADGLIVLCAAAMVITLALYVQVFRRM